MISKMYEVVDRLMLEAKSQRCHHKEGAYRHAAVILERALIQQQCYGTGEVPKIGDIVCAGGDEFRVDNLDHRAGIVKGAIDPCGYAITACTLIKRG